jgi:ketoreductase RED2
MAGQRVAEQRVAVVTGSSSGIGAAVARRLAATGCRVVVNSARSAEAGRALAAALPEAMYIQADISAEDQARTLIDTAVHAYGRLDVLVNNAGTTRRIAHHDLVAATPDIWREILGVNVIGTWQTTVAAVPHLRASESGCVVNVSSLAGTRLSGSSIPYAVSKAAVDHLTRLLAKVLGPQVRVNAVAPGLIDTPWTEGMDEFAHQVSQNAPLRRVGGPDDVAEVVLALVNARYVTGEVVLVDGGLHLM